MNFSLRRMAFSGLAAWTVVLVLCLYFLTPLRKTLRLGIDLVGGSYITLEVQTEKAVEAALGDKLDIIMGKLKKGGMELPKTDLKENSATLVFNSVGQAQEAAAMIKRDEPTLTISSQAETIELKFSDAQAKRIKSEAVERNIEVLRTRLDKLSVAEISIAPRGERNIIVELPDVSDPQQAKALIGTAAVLKFNIVEREGNSPEDILYEYDGQLPAGMEIVPDRSGRHYYMIPKRAAVSGKDLIEARPQFNSDRGLMAVGFTLTPEGGKKFYEMTTRYFGKQLAAVLDGVAVTVATIHGKIQEHGEITGSFTSEEAKELAILLRSGSFVAPVTFEEERQVGPTLGAEAIHQGLVSCLVGLALLFVFCLVVYKIAGLFAFIALLFNLVLVLAGLAWLHATLTLPGIAGLVLTVGMAVDASILIYERIREELRAGVQVKKAVNDGFSDAMRVILDANITTFITGIVLYKFGTGPIQGFAVTLMLGIIATLITGLFFLKALFNFVLDNFHVQKLRI